MRRLVLCWVCVFALGAVALVGCQEVVKSTTYSFQITESSPNLNTVLSQGVEICQADTDNCVTTDADGEAVLVLPANQEIAYTFEKEGYAPWVNGDVTDDTWRITGGSLFQVVSMISDDQMARSAAPIETPYPLTGGLLVLRAIPTRAGVTCEIDTETAKPFYFDEDNVPSLDLTATTSNGDCGFAEVTPGVHEIEFGGTAINCVASVAWPTDVANAIKVPARDGHLTYGSMKCPGDG